jgi:Protein of unknown function (DUF3102)
MAKTKAKAKPAPPGDNKRLPEIAKAIKAIEKALDKLTLPKVLEIGKLLHEADEKCEHGEYMKWVANEFEWSHQTSLNYRNLYDFSKFPNVGNLARLNMSLSTLYMVAGLKDDDQQAARKAIIEVAKKDYVSFQQAYSIIKEVEEEAEPFTAKTERKYTRLITQRQLYEGACHLSWPLYFEYRGEHPECEPLTNDDLGYVRQWTSAAPATTTVNVTSTVDETEPKTIAFAVSHEILKIKVPYRVSYPADETEPKTIAFAVSHEDLKIEAPYRVSVPADEAE